MTQLQLPFPKPYHFSFDRGVFSLSLVRFTPDTMAELVEELQKHPEITSLSLAGNTIDPESAALLANIFEHLPHLTQLDLSRNTMSDEGTRALSSALDRCLARGEYPRLTHLNLSDNQISENGAEALAATLSRLPKLQYLDLSGNHITPALKQLLDNLPRTLTDLSLSHLTNRDIITLTRAMSTGPLQGLESLHLPDHRMTGEGASALAAHLHYRPHLRALDLSSAREQDLSSPLIALLKTNGDIALTLRNPTPDLAPYIARNICLNSPGLAHSEDLLRAPYVQAHVDLLRYQDAHPASLSPASLKLMVDNGEISKEIKAEFIRQQGESGGPLWRFARDQSNVGETSSVERLESMAFKRLLDNPDFFGGLVTAYRSEGGHSIRSLLLEHRADATDLPEVMPGQLPAQRQNPLPSR